MRVSENQTDPFSTLLREPDCVDDLDREELVELLQRVEGLRVQLWSCLHSPPDPSPADPPPVPEEKPFQNGDRLLKAGDVAEVLNVDTRYVYDHADDWPFTRRISKQKLRFSERGLYRWLESRR